MFYMIHGFVCIQGSTSRFSETQWRDMASVDMAIYPPISDHTPTIQAEPAVLAGWSSGTMSGLVQLSLLLLRIYYPLAGILWSKTSAQ